MNYEQAFYILDLRSLNDFVNEPTNPIIPKEIEFLYREDPPEWAWMMFKIRWNALKSITGWGLSDIGARIILIGDVIYYGVYALWDWMLAMPKWWLETKLKGVIEAISVIADYLYGEFRKFLANPWGYLWNLVYSVVKPLIDGIKLVFNVTYDFVKTIWGYLKGFISPLFTSVQNTIIGWIDTVKKTLVEWWNKIVKGWNDFWNKMWEGVLFIREYFPIGSRQIGDEISNKLDVVQSTILKAFDLGLGGLVKAVMDFFTNIWDKIWDWTKGLLNKVLGFLKNEFFIPLWEGVKGAWEWLKDIFKKLIKGAIDLMKKLAPTSPERGEELIDSAVKLLGIGVGGFAALTGVSMAVSWLSKHHLGHLSAILYDMSSYKFVTAALVGGLVTAAYAIPLKYYYNKLFRPYLPEWKIFLDLFNRGIITEDELKDYAAWYGFKDELVWYFERYVATPISLFRQPDMAVWDTSNKGELIEEMRFSGLEEAGVVQYMPALWMKAKSIWLTRMITEMMYNIRRGFALVPEMVEDIKKLVTGTEIVTSSGHRFLPRVTWIFKKMPTTSEILDKISKWATKRLSSDGLVDEVKAEFREDLITADEARTRLSEIIKIPELVEGELAPLIARKKSRDEPKKHKTLRDELKTVMTRCFKEGFVTEEAFQNWVEMSNKIIEEGLLIKARAWWEAYYDDQMDWRKIYVKSLADGIITEAEFRTDLIDLGHKPSKVELLIKYDRAKKLGRVPVERGKLEVRKSRLEFKLMDLRSDLKAVEEDLGVETEPEKITKLERKKTEILEDIAKTEAEISAIEGALAELPA